MFVRQDGEGECFPCFWVCGCVGKDYDSEGSVNKVLKNFPGSGKERISFGLGKMVFALEIFTVNSYSSVVWADQKSVHCGVVHKRDCALVSKLKSSSVQVTVDVKESSLELNLTFLFHQLLESL